MSKEIMKFNLKNELLKFYCFSFLFMVALSTLGWGISNYLTHRASIWWWNYGNPYLSQEFFIIILLISFSALSIFNLQFLIRKRTVSKKYLTVLFLWGVFCIIFWSKVYWKPEQIPTTELIFNLVVKLFFWIAVTIPVFLIKSHNP